jgi:GT2 family glycosyltransferase
MRTSLIITTFNRAKQLKRNFQRILLLPGIPDEILIIDDGSQDETREVCEEFAAKLPLDYIYIHRPYWESCAVARNIGVRQSKGEILFFSEPELIQIEPCFLNALRLMEENPNHVVSSGEVYFLGPGVQVTDQLITDPEAFIQRERYVPWGAAHAGPNDIVQGLNLTAPFFMALRREWLIELGGWDERMHGWGFDDHDLLTRLRESGRNQIISREIKVVHQWHARPPASAADGWRKNEKIFLSKKYPDDLVANKGIEWGKIPE